MSRSVEFIPDGIRVRVTPQEVADAWRLRSSIPAQYAIGTADHEADFTVNERDTEPNGFVSIGIFQLSQDEAATAGFPGANLLTLEDSCQVMATTAQRHLTALMNAVQSTTWSDDYLAYLTIAHNQGEGAAVKSIKLHGLNWATYQSRNLSAAQAAVAQAHEHDDGSDDAKAAVAAAEDKLKWWLKVFAYGNDCITGGSRWAEVALH